VKLISALIRIYSYTNPYRIKLYVAIVLSLLASVLWLVVPLGIRELLDAVFEVNNRKLLNNLALGLLVIFVFQSIFGFLGSYILEWVGGRLVTDLRKKLYSHLHKLGLAFFSSQRLGDITSRLSNDVTSVRAAVTTSLSESITQTISLIGSVGLMIVLNWRLSAVVFISVPIVTLASKYYGEKIRKLSRDVQDQLADTTSIAEETLLAIRVVKSFAREVFEVNRYNKAAEDLFETNRYRDLLSNVFWSLIGLSFMFLLVLIFWFGGIEVLAGRLTTGDLVAFIFYALNISRAVGGMSRLYTTFNSAAGATERIFELLDTVPEIEDKRGAIEIEKIRGQVEFSGVSLSYGSDVQTLKNISIKVSPGEIIAIVGPSGAGKTTFLNLIPRFYDATEGFICIDGIDIKELTLLSLRNQIAVVPQDVHLFSSSIRENIRYGKLDASDSEVESAAKAANAHEFIMAYPNQYDAEIGERGVKLSGGQQQRIAIARAILKNPAILLLDEATSALDSESESHVQKALTSIMSNRTTFVVAHRLSTVRNADRIIVLDAGQITAIGTHKELMETSDLYNKLQTLQMERA